MRRLRFVPEGGALVEVTCRTVHGRHLLRPSSTLNEIILGVLGRALRLYSVPICAYAFLSSHYHLLLDITDAHQLANFMRYLNSNLAREVGRLVDWPDGIWSSRYRAIVVSQEEAAQIERLRYVLSNGCKEGLVGRPQDWPESMRSGPWSRMRRSRGTGSAGPRSMPPGGAERISAGSSTRRARPSPSLPYPAGRISPRRPGNDASPAWSARSRPKPRPGGREPEASPWGWGRSSAGILIIVPRAWRDRPHPCPTRSGKARASSSTTYTPNTSPPSAKPLKDSEPRPQRRVPDRQLPASAALRGWITAKPRLYPQTHQD
jgi:hypothetical protein